MDNIERRERGMAYIADKECYKQMFSNKKRIYKYNKLKPWKIVKLNKVLKSILGRIGENSMILQPFNCDYGFNIEVGNNFFANYNFTVLDVAKVKIGDNVFIGPNVAIYTAGHPIHFESRNTLYEYGIPVEIGDNCWIGGNAVICPGVKVGNGSVIGAGSVVTKNIPENVVACGNPCKVIREINEDDKKYYYKKEKFDDEAIKLITNKKNNN